MEGPSVKAESERESLGNGRAAGVAFTPATTTGTLCWADRDTGNGTPGCRVGVGAMAEDSLTA